MVPRIAITAADAESMRLVRNSCRSYMTRNTARISRREQMAWWSTLDRETITPYLYSLDDEDIGYAILARSGSLGWLSGGLLPSAREHGRGRALFGHLVEECVGHHLLPCLEVLETNNRARALYVGLGFEPVSTHDGVQTMILVL